MNGLICDISLSQITLGVQEGFWTPPEHRASSVPYSGSHSWTQSGAPSTLVAGESDVFLHGGAAKAFKGPCIVITTSHPNAAALREDDSSQVIPSGLSLTL